MNRWRSDEGAVAATVTVCLLALIGTSMLAIDGGALFSSRRNLITDTDAAALAGVRELAYGTCSAATRDDAEAAAREVLSANDAAVVADGAPAVVCNEWSGRVDVSAIRNTDLALGGLAGLPDVDVTSTSIAQFGQIESGYGLRPIAICDKDPHFLEFSRATGHIDDQGIRDLLPGPDGDKLLALVDQVEANAAEHPTARPNPGGGTYPPGNHVHRVYFSRVAVSVGCTQSSGNWGWLDFDGGGGGADQVKDWLRYGYDHPVTVGPNEDCATEVDTETDCIGEPGAGGNSWDAALSDIDCPPTWGEGRCIAEGLAFPIIVFGECDAPDLADCGGSGNGANARYDPDAFVGVILRNWSKVNGNPNDQSYFDFQFVDPFITNGTIVGSAPGSGPGMIGIQICGGGMGATIDDYCSVP